MIPRRGRAILTEKSERGQGSRMKVIHPVFGVLCALALWGCGSLGPSRVEVDSANYSAAVSKAERTNVLQNVVALRYGETPEFLELTQVVTSYNLTVDGSVGVAGKVTSAGDFPETVNLGTGATYRTAPTMTYHPISGREYLGSILLPIDEARALSAIPAGWPPDLVIGLLIKSINGVENSQGTGLSRRPASAEFVELTQLFTRLIESGALEIRVDLEADSKQTGIRTVLFAENPALFGQDTPADLRRFRQLLRLRSSVQEFVIRKGRLPRRSSEIAIQTRSLAGVLGALASAIDVPQGDIDAGKTYQTVPLPASGALPSAVIRSGPSAPPDAFAAVRRGDTWFWVDDNDYASKRVLSFTTLILSLVSRSGEQADPILTISASGG